MARRRYQEGSLHLRGNSWESRWVERVVVNGEIVERRPSRKLGTKHDYPTRKLAMRAHAAWIDSLQINDLSYQPRPVSSFAAFAEKWQNTVVPQMKPSSQPSIKSQLRVHILPLLGSQAMKDINAELLQSCVSEWSTKLNAKTVKNLVATLRSMWNSAQEWGYVDDRNPLLKLRLPKWHRQEQPYFTMEQMVRIIAAASEPYKTFFWLAAETGMRSSELCGLRWCDVDIRDCVVRVRQGSWRGRIDSPKTEKGMRRFGISTELAEHLGRVLCATRRSDMQLVFHASTDAPLDGNLIVTRKLYPILDALGIPRAGLHAFRHGNETLMDQMRVPDAVRMNRMGHADTRMMLNYSHAVSQDEAAFVERIGAQLAPVEGRVQ